LLNASYCPVPDRGTDCGLPPPVSVIVNDPVSVPAVVGVKVTLMVQVPFGPTEVQLFVSAKEDASVPVIATFDTVIVPEPLTFENVMVCGLLVVPTVCAANVKLAGVSLTAVATPFSATVCGLLPALSVTLRFAVRVLILVGLKATLIVQLEFAASVVPQVVVSVKSFGSVPVKPMLEMVTAVEFGLLNVTGCEGLEVANSCVPKVRDAGAIVRLTPPAAPVPVSATDCAPPPPLSFNVTAAVSVPVVDGVKVTEIVQLEFAAKELPQVFVCAKSDSSVPVMEIPLLGIVMASGAKLVSVMV